MSLMGCASVHYDANLDATGRPNATLNAEQTASIQALSAAIAQLDASINPQEAQQVAHDAHVYPLHLANEWQLVAPPQAHNLLVVSKKRKFGLCIDWTQAMRDYMLKLKLKTVQFYWAVANKGSTLREHSTLVVTAKNKPVESGVVLDPWRNSGRLYWAKTPQDNHYQWFYYAGPYFSSAP